MEIKEPDVIIVGSGAGGGTTAKAFTDYGLSVVVFEKGPRKTAEDFVPYDELHFQDHKALRPLKEKDPDIHVGPKPTDVPTRSER